ncbi:hypothetical protein BD769DRAFT_1666825 [Suillus cothurnatus]|nr:hypothetical protein BD769DRAFT_1666825 [Suillus cothurnatus]
MPPTSARVLLLVSASEPPVEVEAPTDACAPRVLEIVPDVEPARVLGLAEHFIHNPVNARQNEGQTEKDEEGAAHGQPAPKIDYVTTDREFKGGIHYFELALEQFMVDFSYMEAVFPNAAAKTAPKAHAFPRFPHLCLLAPALSARSRALSPIIQEDQSMSEHPSRIAQTGLITVATSPFQSEMFDDPFLSKEWYILSDISEEDETDHKPKSKKFFL